MTCMHSTETVFAGSITRAAILAHSLALLFEKVLQASCGRRLFALQDIFFKRCFLKSIFRSERDTLKSYNSKGICPFYVKFGEQLV